MHITFYKSTLCPRCYLARKHLLNIISGSKGISYEEVDVLTSPKRAWKDGVRTIPLLKIDQETLTGLVLSATEISNFINNIKRKKDL